MPLRVGRSHEPLLTTVDRHDGTTSRNPRRALPRSPDRSVTDVSGPYPPAA